MPDLGNPRWEAFAKLTATGRKRADAYLGAGYTAASRQAATKRGVALFAKSEVKARVTELEQELRENALAKAQVDREWVLRGLKDNVERSRQAKPIKDRHGKETGQFKYEPAAVNRGYELIGKELGMFKEAVTFEHLDEELEGMTTKELRAYVRSVATDVGLRMVDMRDDELRDFILKNAERVGLEVVPARTH